MRPVTIAIVGATGMVGRTFLKVLEEKNIAIKHLKCFASERSKGKEIIFKGTSYLSETITKGCFLDVDYALFSIGGKQAKLYAPQAAEEGAIVIDNSSAFRFDQDVPLVVPEVNKDEAKKGNIIANPNCSTIQSVIPMNIVLKEFGLKTIDYVTYQSVSGSGYKGVNALETNNRDGFYPYNISDTCIPEIDVIHNDGNTFEEYKIIYETKKILNNEDIVISAFCMRVPIKQGHGVFIKFETEKDPDLETLTTALKTENNILIKDDLKNHIYPTTTSVIGTDYVEVGRLKKLSKSVYSMYVTADNLRKGAAGNAVDILVSLLKERSL